MPGFDSGVMFADNVDFRGAVSSGSAQVTQDGQLLIGSAVSPNIRVGTLGSSDSSITWTTGNGTITGQVTGGATTGKTITGDTGGALPPTAGNWNILANTNAGKTVNFVGSGSTLNLKVTDSSLNTLIGSAAGNLLASGAGNVALGASALYSINIGGSNVCIGTGAGSSITDGGGNICIGTSTGDNITTGTTNVLIGSSAGINYQSTESNNIAISNSGTLGESNVCRIGTYGTSTSQQNTLYLLGTQYPVNVSANQILYTSAAGVVSTLANGTTGQVLTATTSAAPSWASPAAGGMTWSVITADQNITVGNGYICNKAGLLTLTLPASPTAGNLFSVTGMNTATGWKIAQNANQVIHFGTLNTTTGVGGSLASTNIRDSISLVCVVGGASAEWNVLTSLGNITVT